MIENQVVMIMLCLYYDLQMNALVAYLQATFPSSTIRNAYIFLECSQLQGTPYIQGDFQKVPIAYTREFLTPLIQNIQAPSILKCSNFQHPRSLRTKTDGPAANRSLIGLIHPDHHLIGPNLMGPQSYNPNGYSLEFRTPIIMLLLSGLVIYALSQILAILPHASENNIAYSVFNNYSAFERKYFFHYAL